MLLLQNPYICKEKLFGLPALCFNKKNLSLPSMIFHESHPLLISGGYTMYACNSLYAFLRHVCHIELRGTFL